MQYVVIEYFGEPTLVTDEDGKVKQFDNTTDAIEEARNCQNGIAVPLCPTLLPDIANAAGEMTLTTLDHEDVSDELDALYNILGFNDDMARGV